MAQDGGRTGRQELSDQLAADVERLELRKQTSEEFKALSGAAQDAGVQSKMFGVFHDAGYKGLYGDLGREFIKQRKCIPEKDNLIGMGVLVVGKQKANSYPAPKLLFYLLRMPSTSTGNAFQTFSVRKPHQMAICEMM